MPLSERTLNPAGPAPACTTTFPKDSMKVHCIYCSGSKGAVHPWVSDSSSLKPHLTELLRGGAQLSALSNGAGNKTQRSNLENPQPFAPEEQAWGGHLFAKGMVGYSRKDAGEGEKKSESSRPACQLH